MPETLTKIDNAEDNWVTIDLALNEVWDFLGGNLGGIDYPKYEIENLELPTDKNQQIVLLNMLGHSSIKEKFKNVNISDFQWLHNTVNNLSLQKSREVSSFLWELLESDESDEMKMKKWMEKYENDQNAYVLRMKKNWSWINEMWNFNIINDKKFVIWKVFTWEIAGSVSTWDNKSNVWVTRQVGKANIVPSIKLETEKQKYFTKKLRNELPPEIRPPKILTNIFKNTKEYYDEQIKYLEETQSQNRDSLISNKEFLVLMKDSEKASFAYFMEMIKPITGNELKNMQVYDKNEKMLTPEQLRLLMTRLDNWEKITTNDQILNPKTINEFREWLEKLRMPEIEKMYTSLFPGKKRGNRDFLPDILNLAVGSWNQTSGIWWIWNYRRWLFSYSEKWDLNTFKDDPKTLTFQDKHAPIELNISQNGSETSNVATVIIKIIDPITSKEKIISNENNQNNYKILNGTLDSNIFIDNNVIKISQEYAEHNISLIVKWRHNKDNISVNIIGINIDFNWKKEQEKKEMPLVFNLKDVNILQGLWKYLLKEADEIELNKTVDDLRSAVKSLNPTPHNTTLECWIDKTPFNNSEQRYNDNVKDINALQGSISHNQQLKKIFKDYTTQIDKDERINSLTGWEQAAQKLLARWRFLIVLDKIANDEILLDAITKWEWVHSLNITSTFVSNNRVIKIVNKNN